VHHGRKPVPMVRLHPQPACLQRRLEWLPTLYFASKPVREHPYFVCCAATFVHGRAMTYAGVLHGSRRTGRSTFRRATHERAEFFELCASFFRSPRCHANVAEISMHDICCTGVMACRELKFAFHKGGLGMTRGVSF